MKEIQLTQGKTALVDDEDFETLSKRSWSAHWNYTKWYAVANINSKVTKMHRLIMKAETEDEIDHKDGNGLNNQKANLWFCTRAQNLQNRRANTNSTSQYVGVYFENWTNKWCAAIKKDGRTRKIGRYLTEEEAARARDKVALEVFGSHCRLNFPDSKEDDGEVG
jgi:hypothetical protein